MAEHYYKQLKTKNPHSLNKGKHLSEQISLMQMPLEPLTSFLPEKYSNTCFGSTIGLH